MSTCGICAKEHRMAECGETNPERYKCVNCNTTGHALWDHTCPKFLAASEQIEKSDLESMYKYFRDENPWTWEQKHTEGEHRCDQSVGLLFLSFALSLVPVLGLDLAFPSSGWHAGCFVVLPVVVLPAPWSPLLAHCPSVYGWQRTQPRNQSRPGTRPG
jgi:hypothetical protein